MGANCLGCNPRDLPGVWYAKQNPREECLL